MHSKAFLTVITVSRFLLALGLAVQAAETMFNAKFIESFDANATALLDFMGLESLEGNDYLYFGFRLTISLLLLQAIVYVFYTNKLFLTFSLVGLFLIEIITIQELF